MTVIKEFGLKQQRQEEAFGFHKLINTETAKCTDAKVIDLQASYTQALTAFDKSLKTGGASIYSEQLVAIDARRDEAYSGLAGQIRNCIRHFDPEKAAAAKEADLILRKYGNPTALPYVQENGVIHNIIQDLEDFDQSTPPAEGGGDDGGDEDILSFSAPSRAANRLATIGAREWLDRFKTINEQFLTIFTLRNTKRATVVTGESTAARRTVDGAYRALVKRINALVEVNGDTDYLEIINAINTLIDRQKAVLAARKTANAKKKKEEEKGEDVLK